MQKEKAGELFPIIKLLPNIATLIGLCVGLFALKYAIMQRWELAVELIILATVIDGIDGRLARMLNASSELGAQLDSLADFFNFGVAPALVIYLWMTHEIKGLGWAITLFFIIAMALRLARFNVSLDDEEHDDRFFYGVPAPCGAGLSLLPVMLTFLFQELNYTAIHITPLMVIVYTAFIAFLMVSRIPTISIKKVTIQRKFTSLFLAGTGLFIVALITEPWMTLPILAVLYLCTIPFSVLAYYKK